MPGVGSVSRSFFFLLPIFLAVLVVALPTAADDKKKKMSVQVRKTSVREKASALGKPIGSLKYGDRVEILESSGKAWHKIKNEKPALTGWTRVTALSPKRIVLESTGTAPTSVTGEEVAMAGKGFDEEVEKEYRKKNPNLQKFFAILDRIEQADSRDITAELSAFLDQGRLKPKEVQ